MTNYASTNETNWHDNDFPAMTSADIADMICGKQGDNVSALQVGDRVEVVGIHLFTSGKQGDITQIADNSAFVRFGLESGGWYSLRELQPVASAPASVDIDALKSSWRSDPCWNIEDTAGFEAYHDELLEYRLSIEKQAEQRLIDRAKAVDCSVETMRFIEMLESRIRTLENRLDSK